MCVCGLSLGSFGRDHFFKKSVWKNGVVRGVEGGGLRFEDGEREGEKREGGRVKGDVFLFFVGGV